MNTVIVPYDFAAPGLRGRDQRARSTSPRPSTTSSGCRPARRPSRSTWSAAAPTPGSGQMRFLRWHPFGQAIDDNAVSNCYNPPAAAGCLDGQPDEPDHDQPAGRRLGGVGRHPPDVRRGRRPVHADGHDPRRVRHARTRTSIPSATIGVPVARSYTLTNLFGAFTGRVVGTTARQRRSAPLRRSPTSSSSSGRSPSRPGPTSLRATIGGTSDPAADLDLFVFNCTSGTCVLAGQSADGDSEESVTINNPGRRALADPRRWLRRPGRDDDVQLHRRVREARSSAASSSPTRMPLRPAGLVLDRPGDRDRERGPGRGPRPATATSRSGPTRTSSSGAATSSSRASRPSACAARPGHAGSRGATTAPTTSPVRTADGARSRLLRGRDGSGQRPDQALGARTRASVERLNTGRPRAAWLAPWRRPGHGTAAWCCPAPPGRSRRSPAAGSPRAPPGGPRTGDGTGARPGSASRPVRTRR